MDKLVGDEFRKKYNWIERLRYSSKRKSFYDLRETNIANDTFLHINFPRQEIIR